MPDSASLWCIHRRAVLPPRVIRLQLRPHHTKWSRRATSLYTVGWHCLNASTLGGALGQKQLAVQLNEWKSVDFARGAHGMQCAAHELVPLFYAQGMHGSASDM